MSSFNKKIFFFIILAFNGGFVDASSVVVFNVFTGHLTGNSILSLVHLSKLDFHLFFLSITSLTLFFTGSFLGVLFNGSKKLTTFPLLVLIIILCIFTSFLIIKKSFESSYLDVICVALISLSMGIQNGFFSKIESIDAHSTYITGMTTSIIKCFFDNDINGKKKVTLIITVFSFILGGALGAFLSVNYGVKSFYLAFLLILALILYVLLFKFEMGPAELTKAS